jgi:peptidoglycan/LPS O-acetylase OafA/YrhL
MYTLKQNNFDLLRFWFAFIVFLVHSYALTDVSDLAVLGRYFSSDLAVRAFFIVSGFLIFMSYENSSNAKNYLVKRAKRIYPAYFFVIIISVLLGAFISTYTLGDYFSVSLLEYIFANLLFLNFIQPNLPGVFEGNQIQAINGALWTLKIEVMFYLTVPLIVWAFNKFGRLHMIIILYGCSVFYSMSMHILAAKMGSEFYLQLQRQLPGQFVYFISGAIGYYYFDRVSRHATKLMLLSVVAFIFQQWLPWLIIQPLALGVIIVYAARVMPYLGNFGKYGDFSYGIYIIHFPILQLLASYTLFDKNPWEMLFVASLIILMGAFLLWHIVEKNFLQKSSHYIDVEQI